MVKKTTLMLWAGLLFFTACGGGAQKGSKDVLIIATGAEAVSLDPYKSNDSASSQVRANIFDRLIERDNNGVLTPSLATEWRYTNPVTLELKLREGVKFHNGEIFSAKDVKYSLDRALISPEVEHIVGPIKEIVIVKSNTVQIILKEAFAPILAHLSHPAVSIMNEKAVQDAGEAVGQQPVGTGAFKFSVWNYGQNIVLERNPDYWGEAAKLERVEFRTVPEASARTIALETGDVDVIYNVDDVDRERVAQNSQLVLLEEQSPRMEYIGFNIGKGKNPIWKDARVRQAVSLAIDRPGIINSVLFGAAAPAGSALQESVVGAVKLPPIVRDVEKAKALLAEANVPAGTKVKLWTPQGAREKIMTVIQNNLKEIGLDAAIEVLEWGRYLSATANGDHDIFILGWTTVTLDADYGLYNLLHTQAWGGAGNRSFYSNKAVDKLLEDARRELDSTKRNSLYKVVQETVVDENPLVALYYPFEKVGTKKIVKNFGFDKTASHRLKDTYKE